MTKTNPITGLAGEALPAEMACDALTWARRAGEEHARELLECVCFFQEQPGDSPEAKQAAGRAVLEGFAAPLLPLLADALARLGSSDLACLLDDLSHGAAHALDLMGREEEA
jgi:hypothetical protein